MHTTNIDTYRPIHPENLILIGTGTIRYFIVTLTCRIFIIDTTTDKMSLSDSLFIAGCSVD